MNKLIPVLLVEKDPEARTFICSNLLKEGFEVEAAESGAEGLDLALSPGRAYRLILLEIVVPGISGFGLLKQLRDKNVSTPVMVISGLDRVEMVIKALDLGADDYLRKPFDKREMMARIRALLRRVNPSVKE